MRPWIYFVVFVVSVSGCSVQEQLPLENRPCAENGACLEGYTCVSSTCIPVGGTPLAAPCLDSLQCADNAVCLLPGIYEHTACRDPCQKVFEQSTCPNGTFCVPGVNAEHERVAACVPGTEGTVLAALTPPCTVSCHALACGNDCPAMQSCQPVGTTQKLVCLDIQAGVPLGEQNAPCDLHEKQCNPSYGCYLGSCKKYCEVAVTDVCASQGATTCLALTNGSKLGHCR